MSQEHEQESTAVPAGGDTPVSAPAHQAPEESPVVNPGAPVEAEPVTDTQVHAAVERAVEGAADEGTAVPARPVIAETVEPPNAARVETAEEIFASHAPRGSRVDPQTTAEMPPLAPAEAKAHAGQPEQMAAPGAAAVAPEATQPAPSAQTVASSQDGAADTLAPVHDGEIRVSADHPMAAFYMQTPMPPEKRGNRAAGTLIAVLATIVFAAVYAGALALTIAFDYPPSTFVTQGLMPLLLSWSFGISVVTFFLSLVVLVLIVGRAGWWAYVLGGFIVGVLVWFGTSYGMALDQRFGGTSTSLQPASVLTIFGVQLQIIAAGIIAREVVVWFGAWIGNRGRKMKRLNEEAELEYEKALSEVQATQP